MSEHDSGDEQPPTPLDRGQAFARCMRGFGNELAAMFGGPLYLVGSMLTSDAPGDIDLRLMLDRETAILYWGEGFDGPSWDGKPAWFARKREELKQSRRLTRTFGRGRHRIDFQFQVTLFGNCDDRGNGIDGSPIMRGTKPFLRVDTVPDALFTAGRGEP